MKNQFAILALFLSIPLGHAAGEPLDRLSLTLKQTAEFTQTISGKTDCKLLSEVGSFSLIVSTCEICAKADAAGSWNFKVFEGTPVVLTGISPASAKGISATAKIIGRRSDNNLSVPVNLQVNCDGSAVKFPARIQKILAQLFIPLPTGTSAARAGMKAKTVN